MTICLASKQKPDNIDILMAKAAIYDSLNQPKKKMEVFDNILRVNRVVFIL